MGFENLRDEEDMVDALVELKTRHPTLRKAVVKLNEGFSGEGNALFSFEGSEGKNLRQWVETMLPRRLKFEAEHESWEYFRHKFAEMQGIVEMFIEGDVKTSPSVQCRITPLGEAITISTHDQVMGGPSGQIFQGCLFPAHQGLSAGYPGSRPKGGAVAEAAGRSGALQHRLHLC